MTERKQKKNPRAEAVRKAGGAIVAMLSGQLKGKLSEEAREEAVSVVAREVDRQARLLEGTASDYDKAWAKGHSPDPIEVRAQSIIFGQGVAQ